MTVLSPALDAAFSADRVTMFGALKIELPGFVARLLDGSAEIDIGGEEYAGSVPGFGSWESIEDVSDGFGDEAPGTTVVILPESDGAAANISAPTVQGSPITIMVGARDDETGLMIGDPYVPLLGIIDVPIHTVGLRETTVEYDVVSDMEYLMFDDEDMVMAPAFHRRVWPDEAGMDHVTGVTDNGYWGQNPPSGGIAKGPGLKSIASRMQGSKSLPF